MLPLALKLRLLEDVKAVPAGDDSYGLARCQGFTVYDEGGRVGTVCRVEFGRSPSRSDALVVRSGLFIRRIAHIPTTEIDEICVPERRIILRSHPGQDILRALRPGQGRPLALRPD
jgi:hypothetical protein